MKSMALRGTFILLAAVALIGAVVALRVAQAQQSNPKYTISVTPSKVLEGSAATITVKVTVKPAFDDDPNLYLYIANENDGDGCDIISATCADDASRGEQGDFNVDDPNRMTHNATDKSVTATLNFTPRQDNTIEDDEKIYLALCTTATRTECTGSKLLKTDSITIVGEEKWADNTKNGNTSTVALKGNTADPQQDQPVAASFTTDSDPNGYRMNNVKLKFGGDADDDNDNPANVSVKLFRDDTRAPGAPGAFISNLTPLGDHTDLAGKKAIIH